MDTYIHYSSKVPLFLPCGAWVVAHRGGCTAVRHQDARTRGIFSAPHAARSLILLSTRNRLRQELLLVGINSHTRCSSTFLCFHSCTARVVALHQQRACAASGVRREKCLFPFRILEGRQPFPHDSRAGFLLCDGSNSQQSAVPVVCTFLSARG